MAATASSFPPPMPSPGPHSGPFPLTSGSVPNGLPNGLPAMPPEPVVPPPLTSGSGPNGLPNGLPPMPPGPALPPPPNRGGYGLDHRVRNERSGRWTPDEKLLFLHGLKIYGRGRWKKIRHFLPTRSLVQIKSHAQKVLKREQAGDDIFAALKTHKEKLEMLLKNKDHLFHPMINTPSLDANQGYGMIHGKHMPTCKISQHKKNIVLYNTVLHGDLPNSSASFNHRPSLLSCNCWKPWDRPLYLCSSCRPAPKLTG
jgi:SHAQKYF class myb-like DNA-binding protein